MVSTSFFVKGIGMKRIAWIALFLFGLEACATSGAMVHHSFSFDSDEDSPNAEVLDYQYGTSSQFGTHADKARVARGQTFPSDNISGGMPRGDFLYVKWRIKSPVKQSEYVGTYEDTVDLRIRLPANITSMRVHFVIRGPQLYVYLISPELKPASEPEGPVRAYASQKQVQIYPD
jgi:hypothetical protein